jgi:hypothetical protein
MPSPPEVDSSNVETLHPDTGPESWATPGHQNTQWSPDNKQWGGWSQWDRGWYSGCSSWYTGAGTGKHEPWVQQVPTHETASWSSSSWQPTEYSQAELLKPDVREKGTGYRVSDPMSGRRVLDSMYPPGRGSQPAAAEQTKAHKEEAWQQSTDMARKRIVIQSRGDRDAPVYGRPCHFVNAKQLFDPDGDRQFSGLHLVIMQSVAQHERFYSIMRDIKKFIIKEAAKNTKEMYLDICCSKGKHRSVALAAIVDCMLSDYTPELDYDTDTHHVAQGAWGRHCNTQCVGCRTCTLEHGKLMKHISHKWLQF